MSSTPARPVEVASSPPLILHVTEAMGGGLEDAVHDFVRSAPQYRHALLFTRRGAFATSDHHPDNLVEVVDAGRGFLSLDRAYGPTVARLQPDLIHLHSAWAGLIGRARSLGRGRTPIVYSPHSYFFDRRDLAAPTRGAARLLERALSTRTALTAAVSPFEAQTARRLGSPSAYIPNVARLLLSLQWDPAEGPADVLLVGRITAQKDPEFLLRVVQRVRLHRPALRFTWVGSGDPRTEARLRDAGVHVTGWVSRGECLGMMTRATAYLHTAAWEGSPITLLEAAAIGVPIVARSIPALDSLGFDPLLGSPEAVAEALLDLLDGGPAPVGPPAAAPADQADAIAAAYASLVPVGQPAPAQSDPTPKRELSRMALELQADRALESELDRMSQEALPDATLERELEAISVEALPEAAQEVELEPASREAPVQRP